MTNAQTEARALLEAAGARFPEYEDYNAAVAVIATAIAAKAAELAEAKAQLQRQFDQTVRFQGYLVEAKAQLAEANRALKSIEKEAKKNKPDPDKIWDISRRAREQGGENNG